MKAVSAPETIQFFEEQYQHCQIRYGDMKKQLADDMIAFTEPIYNRIMELRNDEQYLGKVARQGAEKARASASTTIKEVREIMGFRTL